MTLQSVGPRLVGGLLLAVIAGCAEPSSETGVGSLEVTATTTGSNPDPDGYRAALDGDLGRPLGVNDTLLYPSVDGGEHRLTLGGISGNCTLAGDAERIVTVNAEETSTVEFAITCQPTSGNLAVRTVSTGDDIDPNGYSVLIDDQPRGTVASTGTIETSVTAGEHTVALADATANCSIAENPRTTTAVTGGTVPITFTVSCLKVPPAGRGAEILFFTDRNNPDESIFDIARMNTDGTGVGTWFSADGPASWSPDGQSLAIAACCRILIAGMDNEGNPSVIRVIADGDANLEGVAWSPDGSEIAYLSEDPESGCNDLFLISPDGNNQRPLAAFFFACYHALPGGPTWSPDGSTLAVSIFGLFSEDINGIVVLDSSGETDLRQLTTPALEGRAPSWSPDGSRIALASVAPGETDYDVFIVGADGNNLTRLTDTPGDDGAPSWSPDGSKIAFVSHRDGNAEIYVMDADGSHPVRLTNHSATDTLPAWRP